MNNTYIQDKLAEFDDRFAIIVDEKIDGKVYLNRDYGDFYGQRDELKDFIKEMFTDYHNHIVDKCEHDIKLLKLIHKQELDSIALKSLEDFINWSEHRKSLQDTNPKE